MLRPAEFFKTAIWAEYVKVVHDRLGAGFQSLIAIPVDKLMHLGDAGRAWVLQPVAAALLPVFDPVEAHLTGPPHSAFHEAEIEAWVASHETTQENTPREGVVRFSEVADVVVGEVTDGGAVLPAATA